MKNKSPSSIVFICILVSLVSLGFLGCGKDDGASAASGSSSASEIKGESSIEFSGPVERVYSNARARLFKPGQVWYLVIRGSEGNKDIVSVTFALKPGFLPKAETYAVEPFPGIDRPEIFGTIEYVGDREDAEKTGRGYVESTEGSITFDSVEERVSGVYEFTSKDESGDAATVKGTFKVDRPEEFGPSS